MLKKQNLIIQIFKISYYLKKNEKNMFYQTNTAEFLTRTTSYPGTFTHKSTTQTKLRSDFSCQSLQTNHFHRNRKILSTYLQF